jgi:sugar lactone lactonase YvrE
MERAEKVEHLLAIGCRLGEGPRWNVAEGKLYWVDIESHCFYRMDPTGGEPERFEVGLPVSVLGFRASGGLIMATREGFATYDLQTSQVSIIDNPEADRGHPESRFNDGATDSNGRFWAGTMTHEGAENALYRLDPDGTIHTMERGLTITNGMGWSPDNHTMYLTDTNRRVIYAYAYDAPSGTIANRRNFVEVLEDEGWPDGLTIDAEGFVWSAHYGGSRITRYDPDGKIERVVELPVTNITSCCFGGPDLTDLYITTAWSGLTEKERERQQQAGDLFILHTTTKGRPEPLFAG